MQYNTNSPLIHPLSVIERSLLLAFQEIPLNFVYMARVTGPFSDDQLHQALSLVRRQHWLCAVRLEVDTDGSARVTGEGVPDIPLRVIPGAGPRDWLDLVPCELGEPFDIWRGPLVRVHCLRGSHGSDIVITCHHGLYDGLSGLYLLRDILALLGEPERPVQAVDISPGLVTLIPPSVTRHPLHRLEFAAIRLALSFGLLRLLRWFWRRSQPPRSPEETPPWKRFCADAWVIDEAQTRALVERCRQEGTTVHSAISVAWMRAFAETLVPPGTWRRWQRTVSTPVNLRGRLTRPVGESLGFYLTTVETLLDCSPNRPFWEAARVFKRKLARGSRDDRVFWFMLLNQAALSSLPWQDAPEMIREINARPITYDFSMTNLGRLDFPTQSGDLRIEGYYGPFADGSEQERVVGTLTFDGRMYFTLIYRDFVLSPQQARNLTECAKAILQEAVRRTS
jgi:hypothetical protein